MNPADEIAALLVESIADFSLKLVEKPTKSWVRSNRSTTTKVKSELVHLKWFAIDFAVRSMGERSPGHSEIMGAVVERLRERGRESRIPVDRMLAETQARLLLYAEAVNESDDDKAMLPQIGNVFARLCAGQQDAALADIAVVVFSSTHISLLPFLDSAMEK